MELDAEQFERLLQVLGTEPATNILSAANITAVMSVLIAFILGALTFIEYDRRRREKDADFIFKSERDYGELFDDLVAVGEWTKLPGVKAQLALIDKEIVELDRGEGILSAVQIPEEMWRHARSVKTHFKSVKKFHSQGIVSQEAVLAALDQWGFRLLMGAILRMDVHRYYYARRDEPERVDQKDFDAEFAWYRLLHGIKPIENA